MNLPLRARVRSGRLVLDEVVELPDGTWVELAPADERDDLDDDERLRPHAAIAASRDGLDRGEAVPAEQVLD
jgi:hypothetical protein